MSEMVERVAQRMADEVLLKHQLLLDDQAKTLARAAINAMRELTEEMTRAVYDTSISCIRNHDVSEDDLLEIWRTMIDAVLK